MCPLFWDFKNHENNYDVFSKFCQHIVQIEDTLDAEYSEWLVRNNDSQSVYSQSELGDATGLDKQKSGNHMPTKF